MVFNRFRYEFCQTSRAVLLTSALLVSVHLTVSSTSTSPAERVLSAKPASELMDLHVKETGETHRLDLAAGEYVELRLHRDGDPILRVSLNNSNGQRIVETRTGRYEDLVLRFITDGASPYYLTITPFDKESVGTTL